MSRPSRLPELIAAMDTPGTAASRRAIVERFGQTAFDLARKQGTVQEMLPHIYAHSQRVNALNTRMAAATSWLRGSGALSGAAACAIHGLPVNIGYPVTIVVGLRRRVAAPKWLRVRRLSRPMPTIMRGSHRVVRLPYALIQVWWDEGADVGRDMTFDAIRRRLTTTPQLIDALRQFPRIPHRRELARFLEQLSKGIRSYLEELADSTVLTTPELNALLRQVELRAVGRTYYPDAFDPETRTAIEFDGAAYHSDDDARRRDLERDVALATIGVQTLRFTYEDITRRPEWCRAMILRTIAARRLAAERPAHPSGAQRSLYAS